MSKQILLIILAVAVVVGGVSFYGGMKYGEGKGFSGKFPRQNFQELSPEQRQQFVRRNSGENFRQGFGPEPGTAFLSGEVINKDAESLTIKLKDSGSKIVFFSNSTEIRKFIKGSAADIEVGEQVVVNGDENSDGSYTAKIIQISQDK